MAGVLTKIRLGLETRDGAAVSYPRAPERATTTKNHQSMSGPTELVAPLLVCSCSSSGSNITCRVHVSVSKGTNRFNCQTELSSRS